MKYAILDENYKIIATSNVYFEKEWVEIITIPDEVNVWDIYDIAQDTFITEDKE